MAVILKIHSKYEHNTMRDTCVKCHNEINTLSVCYEHSTMTDTCVKPILFCSLTTNLIIVLIKSTVILYLEK